MKEFKEFLEPFITFIGMVSVTAVIINNFPSYAPAFIPVALIVSAWYVYRLINRWKSPTVLPVSDVKRFLGPLSYSSFDKDVFYGRGIEARTIASILDREDPSIRIIQGKCGAGKTSLVRAGVIPALTASHTCVYVSFHPLSGSRLTSDELSAFLLGRINDETGGDFASMDEIRFENRAILFLDQFEQVFDRLSRNEFERFVGRLERLSPDSGGKSKICLIVRTEYFGRLYPFLTVKRDFIFSLSSFNTEQAREVIRGTCGFPENPDGEEQKEYLKSVISFEELLLNDLMDKDDCINPVELSIICFSMIKKTGGLSESAYLRKGGKEGWLDIYLEDELLKFSGERRQGFPDRTAVLEFLTALISENKAITLSPAEIAARSGIQSNQVDIICRELEESRIIMKVKSNDWDAIRLSHEYLIQRIKAKAGIIEPSVQKFYKMLSLKYNVWEAEGRKKRYLLSLRELGSALKFRKSLKFETEERHRRYFGLSTTYAAAKLSISFLAAIVFISALFAYWYILDERKDIVEITKAFQYQNDATKVEDELLKLSAKPYDFKEKILLEILREEKYKAFPRKYLMHAILGVSVGNAERWVNTLYSRYIDGGPELQLSIVEALGEVNIPESVDRLTDIFKTSRDSGIRLAAVKALGSMNDGRLVDILLGVLQSSNDREIQYVAAYVLGEMRHPGAVDTLIKVLGASSHSDVQAAAICALGKIKDPAAAGSLVGILMSSDNPDVVKEAVYSLGQLNDARSVPALIETIINVDSASEIRRTAASALGLLCDPRAIDPLIKVLLSTGGDWLVRHETIRALQRINNPRTVDILMDSARSTGDPGMLAAVVAALGKLGDPRAIDILIHVLRTNGDPVVQRTTAYSLGELQDPRAADILIDILKTSGNPDLQKTAASALGTINDSRAADILIDILKTSNNPDLRKTVAFALIEITGTRAVDILSEVLKTCPDTEIRCEAIAALGRSYDPRATAVLMQVLAGQNESSVLQAAIRSLSLIGDARTSGKLIDVLRDNGDPDVQRSVVHAFGTLKAPETVDILIETLKAGKDIELRQEAAFALGEIRDKRAVDPLLEEYGLQKPFELKYCCLKAVITITKEEKYYRKLILEILPHPIVGHENETEICRIMKELGGYRGIDSRNDVWDMLEWWNGRSRDV